MFVTVWPETVKPIKIHDVSCTVCNSSVFVCFQIAADTENCYLHGMAAGQQRNLPATGSNTTSDDDSLLKFSVTRRIDTFLPLQNDSRLGRDVPIAEVAGCGFAYFPTSSSVHCVWCNAKIVDWQCLDSVSVVEQLHRDSCPRGPPPEEEPPPSSVLGGQTSLAEDQLEGPVYSNAEVDLSCERQPVPVHLLRQHNERMREERTCKRCGGSQVETLFLPCRHLVACEVCADEVEDCFVCDTKILGTVRIYLL